MSYDFYESMFSGQGGEGRGLVVTITRDRHTWVTLPPALVTNLYTAAVSIPLALILHRQGEPSLAVAWGGEASDAGKIGIPSSLATALGLKVGDTVDVVPAPSSSIPMAESISVEPANADDWEVVELNAGFLEDNALNQVAVVSVNQPLPFWIHGQLVMLKVVSSVPSGPPILRLQTGSEIYVAPRLRAAGGSTLAAVSTSAARNRALVGTGRPQTDAVWRVWLPPQSGDDYHYYGPPDQGLGPVMVAKATLSKALRESKEIEFDRRRSFNCKIQPCSSRLSGPWTQELELVVDNTVPLGHMRMHYGTASSLGLSEFVHARVFLMERPSVDKKEGSESEQEEEKDNGAPTTRHSSQTESRRDKVEGKNETYNSDSFITGGTKNDRLVPPDPRSWLRPSASAVLRALLPVLSLRAYATLTACGVPRPGGIVLSAQRGAGASELIDMLAEDLAASPNTLTHTVRVACGSPDALRLLRHAVGEALARCPSLLVLEDLDSLCPDLAAGGDAQAAAQQAPGAAAAVAELCDLLDALGKPSAEEWGTTSMVQCRQTDADDGTLHNNSQRGRWAPIAVLATARDAAALAPSLKAPGRLDTAVELPAPGVDDRAAILLGELHKRGVVSLPNDLGDLARRAEGYDAADLSTLADRAMHIALPRKLAKINNDDLKFGMESLEQENEYKRDHIRLDIQMADLEAALEGLTPAAYWGAGAKATQTSRISGWDDVGGMDEVREALHESLELPIRYAGILASAPLRLRTGVLLYGPPGCGKTHVVNCAVAAAGVRCITVRGPELLNKYIGASEAAVRDVFARATAAAPSVLFFDEFDAIAPQRGHDNTGVTDRVVNQLLTELDGVEGLRGVCVVAATSRPDLIDAALLRPGRLDRLIFCDFPTPRERGKILSALARSMPLQGDVDLEQLGKEADYMTGADLGALLSEAQLAAAHEALEAAEQDHHGSSGVKRAKILVGQAHLEAALAGARPSVPAKERARFEAIYSHFRAGHESNLGEEPLSPRDKGKRQTLA